MDRDAKTIKEDGLYENADGARFQYRKGHKLSESQFNQLKKVGGWPGEGTELENKAQANPRTPSNSQPRETAAQKKAREKAEAEQAAADAAAAAETDGEGD